jgi:hypothetical protein
MKRAATPTTEAATTAWQDYTKERHQVGGEMVKRIDSVLAQLTKPKRRLLLQLLFKGRKTSGTLCSACSIGNLSDAVIKTNPVLESVGLKIINYPPKLPLLNAYGETTPVHYWELVVIDGKA